MISRIFFVGSPPGMASAPLRRSTSTSLPKTPFNSRNRALGAFFPKLTTSLDERRKAGIFHPSSNRYSTHIDKHCSTCGAVEDDAHLFFHCDLPRAVWFSFTPSMRTDNLPHENDGVQLILQSFISNSTSESLFHKILFTLWYIWKAQNDNHFQRHTWTSMQVHNAVAAHINTRSQERLLSTITTTSTTTGATQSLQQPPQTLQGTLISTAGPAAIAEPSSQTTDTHNIRASTNTANTNSPRYDFFNAIDTNDEQPRDYYIDSATWYKMLR
jgi:hypothetical protein